MRYTLVAALYAVPLFGLALLGLGTRSLRKREKLLLLGPALYFTVIHALTVGSLRYRIPAEPALAVLAAAAAGAGWHWLRRPRPADVEEARHDNDGLREVSQSQQAS